LHLEQQPEQDSLDNSPALGPVSSLDTDRPMAEVEPAPSLSVVDDCKYIFLCSLHTKLISRVVEQIANKDLQPIEQEIIETKCMHWDITNWSQLENRSMGPIMQAGGHDW
jgi:hypothetical protein